MEIALFVHERSKQWNSLTVKSIVTVIRDWSLITWRGGIQNGRGGTSIFTPKKRGGGSFFTHAEGGGRWGATQKARFFFYALA